MPSTSNISGIGAAGMVNPPAVLQSQASFASVLGLAQSAQASGISDEARAREAAEQFVAHTFVLPLLKQLRESGDAAPPFAPSQGEKQFRALMDAELAQRIAHAQRLPLVDRLARDLLRKSGKEPAQDAPASEGPTREHARNDQHRERPPA